MAGNRPPRPPKRGEKQPTIRGYEATSSPSDLPPAERAWCVGGRSVHLVTARYFPTINPCPISWHAQLGLFPRVSGHKATMGLTGHMAPPLNQMRNPPCLVPISRSRGVASAAATGKVPRGWF